MLSKINESITHSVSLRKHEESSPSEREAGVRAGGRVRRLLRVGQPGGSPLVPSRECV